MKAKPLGKKAEPLSKKEEPHVPVKEAPVKKKNFLSRLFGGKNEKVMSAVKIPVIVD